MLRETTTHRTADGDRLDQLCASYYDGETTMLPAVLALNFGLADKPPVLPSGIEIVFPPSKRPVKAVQRLWD